jgi:glutaconyl-CoA/methylmalonyl-CoA decarboxylase subunit delta
MDKFIIGWQLMLVGMGTVLITLYILSLVLRLDGYLFGPREENNSKKKENIYHKDEIDTGIDAKKTAAITAAIYQFMDKKEYHIISIKRVENSDWKY